MKYKNLKEIMSDEDNSEIGKFYEYDIIERMSIYSPTYIDVIPDTDILYRISVIKEEPSNHTKYSFSFGNKCRGIYKTLQLHSPNYDVFTVLSKEFISHLNISDYINEESFNNIISILSDYSDYLKYYTEYSKNELETVRSLRTRQENDRDIKRITGNFGYMSNYFDFKNDCKDDIIDEISKNYSLISGPNMFNTKQFIRYNNSLYDKETNKEIVYLEIRKIAQRWKTDKYIFVIYTMISDNESTIIHTKEIFDDTNESEKVEKYNEFVTELQSKFSLSNEVKEFFTNINISEICESITKSNKKISELEKNYVDTKFLDILKKECEKYVFD